MPVCARDPLHHNVTTGVFHYGKSNSTAIKHVYTEFADSIDCNGTGFDINGWSNFTEMVQVVGM